MAPGRPAFSECAHAADLTAFIETLGVGSIHIVGWSYGANVAMRLVVERHDLVATAFVYETGTPGLITDANELPVFAADARDVFEPVTAAVLAGDNALAATRLYEAIGGKDWFADMPDHLRAMADENVHTMPLLLSAKAQHDTVTAAEAAKLAVPVSVAWGARARPGRSPRVPPPNSSPARIKRSPTPTTCGP